MYHSLNLQNSDHSKYGLLVIFPITHAYVSIYRGNVRPLLLTQKRSGVNIPTNFRDFISEIVFYQDDDQSMNGTCNNCPGIVDVAPCDEDGI